MPRAPAEPARTAAPHPSSGAQVRVLARERERSDGSLVIVVELAEDAVRLGDLKSASRRTIVLLGHEHDGIPDDAWPLLDKVVEIPMAGVGASLNVAVAGSVVLYRLAGLL